jgi:hypothetical protein
VTAAPSGSASARLETCLARIARFDPRLGAVTTVTAEGRARSATCGSTPKVAGHVLEQSDRSVTTSVGLSTHDRSLAATARDVI